jgi:hypothetical protein
MFSFLPPWVVLSRERNNTHATQVRPRAIWFSAVAIENEFSFVLSGSGNKGGAELRASGKGFHAKSAAMAVAFSLTCSVPPPKDLAFKMCFLGEAHFAVPPVLDFTLLAELLFSSFRPGRQTLYGQTFTQRHLHLSH